MFFNRKKKQRELKLKRAIKMGREAVIRSEAKKELLDLFTEEQACFCDKHKDLYKNE